VFDQSLRYRALGFKASKLFRIILPLAFVLEQQVLNGRFFNGNEKSDWLKLYILFHLPRMMLVEYHHLCILLYEQ